MYPKALKEKILGESLAKVDPSKEMQTLLSRAHPERLKPGDLVRVINQTPNNTYRNTFTGVIIGIRRKGIDSSILVRNVISKLGVEMRFFLYSPCVKTVEIVKRGTGIRRSKLYYLREQPGKIFSQ